MSKILSIRVSEEIWEAVHQISDNNNIKVNTLLLEIIETWLQNANWLEKNG